jgi:predicted RNA binding protein YcfA (HicA-like mRNA interferase family)
MASYEKDVRRILAENGCTLVRQGKGDHEIWQSPISGKRFVVDGKIKSRHTANAIMKQAGIDHHF